MSDNRNCTLITGPLMLLMWSKNSMYMFDNGKTVIHTSWNVQSLSNKPLLKLIPILVAINMLSQLSLNLTHSLSWLVKVLY